MRGSGQGERLRLHLPPGHWELLQETVRWAGLLSPQHSHLLRVQGPPGGALPQGHQGTHCCHNLVQTTVNKTYLSSQHIDFYIKYLQHKIFEIRIQHINNYNKTLHFSNIQSINLFFPLHYCLTFNINSIEYNM